MPRTAQSSLLSCPWWGGAQPGRTAFPETPSLKPGCRLGAQARLQGGAGAAGRGLWPPTNIRTAPHADAGASAHALRSPGRGSAWMAPREGRPSARASAAGESKCPGAPEPCPAPAPPISGAHIPGLAPPRPGGQGAGLAGAGQRAAWNLPFQTLCGSRSLGPQGVSP